MTTDPIDELSSSRIVAQLRQYLPEALIASLADVKDLGQVDEWTRGSMEPPEEAAIRLCFALEQAQRIAVAESIRTAASWMTSANEMLDYDLPTKAIREDRFDDVTDAVTTFLDGYAG